MADKGRTDIKPVRYTIKTDSAGLFMESIEDPDGQWIFDPSHTLEVPKK